MRVYLESGEAARRLGVCEATLRTWAAKGIIRQAARTRQRALRLFDEAEVDAMAARRAQGAK